jgi:hypothetical protein
MHVCGHHPGLLARCHTDLACRATCPACRHQPQQLLPQQVAAALRPCPGCLPPPRGCAPWAVPCEQTEACWTVVSLAAAAPQVMQQTAQVLAQPGACWAVQQAGRLLLVVAAGACCWLRTFPGAAAGVAAVVLLAAVAADEVVTSSWRILLGSRQAGLASEQCSHQTLGALRHSNA